MHRARGCARAGRGPAVDRAPRSSGSVDRVVQPQLALLRQERRPPAGPGRQLDDLAADRQRIQPERRSVEVALEDGARSSGGRRHRRRTRRTRERARRSRPSAHRRRPQSLAVAAARAPEPLVQPEAQELVVLRPARRSRDTGAPSPPGRRRARRCGRPHHRQLNCARSDLSRHARAPGPAEATRRPAPRRGSCPGSKSSASRAMPSTTRGPGRLKYAEPSSAYTSPCSHGRAARRASDRRAARAPTRPRRAARRSRTASTAVISGSTSRTSSQVVSR